MLQEGRKQQELEEGEAARGPGNQRRLCAGRVLDRPPGRGERSEQIHALEPKLLESCSPRGHRVGRE